MLLQRLIVCCLFLTCLLHSQKNQSNDATCLNIANRWITESLDITKNCVGFSAPVASRAFSYLAVGIYECGVEKNTSYNSLSNQLTGYNRSTWKTTNEQINWPHTYNYFTASLIRFLYANMPPYNLTKVKMVEDSLFNSYKKKLTKKERIASEDYANRLFNDIKTWSLNDGGHEGYNRNFPKTYTPPSCEACWTVTFPGYLKAQQPYWGSNRLMIESNRKLLDSINCPVFSTDTSSAFYNDAKGIYLNSIPNDKNIELIAEYWDDAPGYSGTPTGHLLTLAIQLTREYKFDLQKSLHFYALLTIAINDAFILCWNTKYKYNLIRPITYIQRYVDPSFNTFIPTPPFPEFPSGHSFQSGAGIEVFKIFFSDTLSIVDSTNIKRRDIDGRPRSFKNFTALASEISMSRYYGGIHFMNTLNLSLGYGSLLGKNTIHSIQFIK